MKVFILIFMALGLLPLGAQSLALTPDDVHIEARADGFHLFVRQRPGMSSVLLTESFELEDNRLPTYALRALEYNAINGDEARRLGDNTLTGTRSLISSTPVSSEALGAPAFHILIPPVVEYGYPDFPNSRYGRHNIREFHERSEPYWFSIRTFELPFADYAGVYRDNAFQIRLVQNQPEEAPVVDEEGLNPGLREGFERFTGILYRADDGEDLVNVFRDILSGREGESLDLVLVMDTTMSMQKYIDAVKDQVLVLIDQFLGRYNRSRIGLVLYRDYMEEYLTRSIPYETDPNVLRGRIRNLRAAGGGDIPEAVAEALHAGGQNYAWESEDRIMILIGDAPPHPFSRGAVSDAMVQRSLQESNIELFAIMLP